MKRILLAVLLVASLGIFAEEKKELNTDFNFHSEVFFNYSYDEDHQGFNNANNRFYLGFTKNINDMISTRLTLDVGKNKGTDRYGAFLKYGLVKMKFTKELSLTMGIFLSPIHGFSNKFWGHRYITAAYGGGYWNAVPQGIMLSYDMGKLFKANVIFHNGTSYKFVGDDDKNKSLDLIILSNPVKGLDLVLHGEYTIPVEDAAPTAFRGTFFLGYSMPLFKLGYQALFSHNKKEGEDAIQKLGHVVYLRIMPHEKFEIFGSYLLNDPNMDVDDDNEMKAIGGIEYKHLKNVKFALSYEWFDKVMIDSKKLDQDGNKIKIERKPIIWISSNLKF